MLTSVGINAQAINGTLTFYVAADSLAGTAGWTMRLNSGTGFVTRLSELIASNQAGPGSRHLVRDDRCPHTASTDGHAALHLSAGNRMGQRHDKIRIIIFPRRLAVAEINDIIAGLPQHSDQIFLQLKPTVVDRDTDGLRHSWGFCRGIRHSSFPARPACVGTYS